MSDSEEKREANKVAEDGGKAKADDKADTKDKKKKKGAVAAPAESNTPAWPVQGNSVDSRIHRRCTWLNCNVFWEGAIDRSAMEALSSLELSSAMELCKDVEAKGPDRVANPSAYLQAAANYERKKESYDQTWPEDDWGWRPAPLAWDYGAKGGKSTHPGSKEFVDDRVHRRCTWLNANVFWASAISEKAIAALSTLHIARAMELCSELESKGPDRVANPSGYIQVAVSREADAGYDDYQWEYGSRGKGFAGYPEPPHSRVTGNYVDDAVHRRCTWLNANVFWPGAIDEAAIVSLSSIDYRRAMEMLADIENRGPHGLAHPSSYLTGSVRHEHEYDAGAFFYGKGPSQPSQWSDVGKGSWGGAPFRGQRFPPVVHRRCTWLNGNVFWEGAISEDAIAKLSAIETWLAMEILEDLEWKAADVANPTKWIKATVENQWAGSYVDNRIHRRCIWLNANVFWEGAIDEDAIRALSTLGHPRAMDLCADIEGKGPDRVSDPSRYLKTAVRRDNEHWVREQW